MLPKDAELLERWRAGDRDAGITLFERYYETVERFFINKVSVDARDLVQETFTACVKSREKLSDPSKFRSYLFTIAYNVLRLHFRRKRRPMKEVDLDVDCMRDIAPGPRSVLVKRKEQRLLLEALRTIPVRDQVVLELHYWEELTTAEMAEILGLPQGTVKGRLQRARGRLEEAMAELSDSPEVLKSTLSDLDDWARQCRHAMKSMATATQE